MGIFSPIIREGRYRVCSVFDHRTVEDTSYGLLQPLKDCCRQADGVPAEPTAEDCPTD